MGDAACDTAARNTDNADASYKMPTQMALEARSRAQQRPLLLDSDTRFTTLVSPMLQNGIFCTLEDKRENMKEEDEARFTIPTTPTAEWPVFLNEPREEDLFSDFYALRL